LVHKLEYNKKQIYRPYMYVYIYIYILLSRYYKDVWSDWYWEFIIILPAFTTHLRIFSLLSLKVSRSHTRTHHSR
jgi:hypothetical protein